MKSLSSSLTPSPTLRRSWAGIEIPPWSLRSRSEDGLPERPRLLEQALHGFVGASLCHAGLAVVVDIDLLEVRDLVEARALTPVPRVLHAAEGLPELGAGGASADVQD